MMATMGLGRIGDFTPVVVSTSPPNVAGVAREQT